MQIQLDKYIFTMQMWAEQVKGFRADPRIAEGIDKKVETDVLRVFWGGIHAPAGSAIVIETGFFWQAAHIDTIGLYQHSSLCTPQALREIENFDASVSAQEIVFEQKQKSKYRQGEDPDIDKDIHWNKIVLALQNPYDRSIKAIASPEDYFKFVDDACKFYGKNLFVKLHPWNSGDVGHKLRKIAYDNGVQVGKISHRIVEDCEFVIVFNSTFAVDCMIRGVPVAQYAPGYFWQNPAVQYTEYTFPNKVKTDIDFGHKTCDFLVWKYCFDHSMPAEKWIQMFEQIAKSREMFPIPREFSYAENKL